MGTIQDPHNKHEIEDQGCSWATPFKTCRGVVVVVAAVFVVLVVVVVGCWLLVVGCWLLVVGCWLLVVGCWLLVVCCLLFVVCCSFRTAVGAHGGQRKTACQGVFMFISLTVASVS